MRKARIKVNGVVAGILIESENNRYDFYYESDYKFAPVSLTMPIQKKHYEFLQFPAFFEGLLPEGIQLEALLRKYKLDRTDYFGQLVRVGNDLVGAVTVEEDL